MLAITTSTIVTAADADAITHVLLVIREIKFLLKRRNEKSP